VYYLIERSDRGRAEWLARRDRDHAEWVTDVHQADRYEWKVEAARDARAYRRTLAMPDLDLAVTEHEDVPAPARKGGPPSVPPAALALLVALPALVGGCGASPLRVQYDALATVAEVYDAATDGAEAALNVQAAACNQEDACLDALVTSWSPVRVAQAGVLLVLQGWASLLGVWEAAGAELGSLVRAALRQVEALGSAWNAWAAAGAGVGWTLPAIPPEVLGFAAAAGGE
jgi:hypothetical protein